jgi:hypothetical protein
VLRWPTSVTTRLIWRAPCTEQVAAICAADGYHDPPNLSSPQTSGCRGWRGAPVCMCVCRAQRNLFLERGQAVFREAVLKLTLRSGLSRGRFSARRHTLMLLVIPVGLRAIWHGADRLLECTAGAWRVPASAGPGVRNPEVLRAGQDLRVTRLPLGYLAAAFLR